MKKPTSLSRRITEQYKGVVRDLGEGKEHFKNITKLAYNKGVRSHETSVDRITNYISFAKSGMDAYGKSYVEGILNEKANHVSANAKRIKNSAVVLEKISKAKELLGYNAVKDFNNQPVLVKTGMTLHDGEAMPENLEKKVSTLEGKNRNDMLSRNIEKTSRHYRMAGGVTTQTLRYLGCVVTGVVLGFVGKGTLDNYNVDKDALDKFAKPNAAVVSTDLNFLKEVNTKSYNHCGFDVNTPLEGEKHSSGVNKEKKVEKPVKIAKKSEYSNYKTFKSVAASWLDTKGNHSPAPTNLDAKVKTTEFVGPTQKVEVKKIRRLLDKDYKPYAYTGHLLNKSGKYLGEKKVLEAATTVVGAGLSVVNETAGRVSEEVLKPVGGVSRTIEKQRLIEKVLSVIGIKKPYQDCLKKDNPKENTWKKGRNDAEKFNDFVFRNLGPIPILPNSGPNWNATHANALNWLGGGFLGKGKGLLHFNTKDDPYVIEDGVPGALVQIGSDASWLIGNGEGGNDSISKITGSKTGSPGGIGGGKGGGAGGAP